MHKGIKIGSIILLVLVSILICSCVIYPRFQKDSYDINDIYDNSNFGLLNEKIICIDDNQDALMWRIRLIKQAKEEIIFSTFNFTDDDSGRDIMAALVDANDRGVKVRLIVDGISGFVNLDNSKYFRSLASLDNISVKIYNPVNLLKPWKINYRMHDKYLICDNEVYILGGRNIKNLSLGNYQDKKDIDRDILVYNERYDERSSLSKVKNYFEKIWVNKDAKPFKRIKYNEEIINNLRTRYQNLEKLYPDFFEPYDLNEETIDTNGITLITNPINANNKSPILWQGLIETMNQGKNVVIQTPYIICNRKMYDDLYNIKENDINIEMITNAVESGANPSGCADYMNQKKNVRQVFNSVYEYVGEHSSHAKTVVVDQDISIVGSFNFDMRSAYLDTEMMLVIDCPELNEHLRSINYEYMDESRKVLSDGQIVYGNKYQEKEIGFMKKILYSIIRIIIIPLRHLL